MGISKIQAHQPEKPATSLPLRQANQGDVPVPLPQKLCVLVSILEFVGDQIPCRELFYIPPLPQGKSSSQPCWEGTCYSSGEYRYPFNTGKLYLHNDYPKPSCSIRTHIDQAGFLLKEELGFDQLAQLVVSFISASCFIKHWSVKRFTLEFCVDTNHGVFQMVTPFGQ